MPEVADGAGERALVRSASRVTGVMVLVLVVILVMTRDDPQVEQYVVHVTVTETWKQCCNR